MQRLSRVERETIITWSKGDKELDFETADPSFIRKLDKKCIEHPSVYRCIKETHYQDGTVCSRTYAFPISYLKVRNPQARINSYRAKNGETN